ncbi:hypothetical protein KDW_22820 [Dictyobacter vulcani]|uniref:Zinc-ribbon domain-containing protein n=1 Tax=Dictyobacter vulcani TaxID=2607529 RepID=A0A5J4KNY7_9CHLR|nr:zinc ribbon domain-containing protein [Dictyobacter vulcani]GER88120.1 hypothetical protein KDW_22820 [Dictyobacter vulcani]
MLCPLCHTQNRDNAKFCKGCGQPLAVEVVAEQPESAEQSTTADQDPTQGTPPPPSAAENAARVDTAPAPNQDAAPVETDDSASSSPEASEKQEAHDEQRGADEEDVSQAPTQILTQQQMLAFHARRWQQETEHEHEGSGSYADIADAPTILMRPGSTPDQAPTQAETIPAPARASDESVNEHSEATGTEPPAPPPLARTDGTSSAVDGDGQTEQEVNNEGSSAHSDSAVVPDKEENVEPTTNEGEIEATTNEENQNSEATEQPNPTPAPGLEVGKIVGGRYEVMQVENGAENEHTYIVTDRQGYLHCWNCGSEQNAEGDEFCIDCGAELLNASYILHEYAASGQQATEAQVLQGAIVNTFVEDGITYVVEQPQTSQTAFPRVCTW